MIIDIDLDHANIKVDSDWFNSPPCAVGWKRLVIENDVRPFLIGDFVKLEEVDDNGVPTGRSAVASVVRTSVMWRSCVEMEVVLRILESVKA